MMCISLKCRHMLCLQEMCDVQSDVQTRCPIRVM